MDRDKKTIVDDCSIVLCGEAGQGIQTIEAVITHIVKQAGYHLFATKEYMSRIRGGKNSTLIRIASHPVAAYVDRIDILVPFTADAIMHLKKRISDTTCIIGDMAVLGQEKSVIDVPFRALAQKAGGLLYTNMVAVGLILGLIGIDIRLFIDYVKARYAKKGDDVINKNIAAAKEGYEQAEKLKHTGLLEISLVQKKTGTPTVLLNGGEAVALGAIAGGCNCITSYPMSPGTTVLTELAHYSHDFSIAVEQAEDEIAAINMAIGAWYAGARAMVTTSGGGFALMCEGVSLAGMIESPVVIHIAQRPGPATGLPTRTEQADLELALYSGHGEFPRIILAPGTIDQAFYCAAEAFNLADAFQIPVFLLTDQFLIDSYSESPAIDIARVTVLPHIIQTSADYKRYKLTSDGISPRGIPGWGEGLVRVDSDEHTEEGFITEDLDLRVAMVDKRLKKYEAIRACEIQPTLSGDPAGALIVVCFGSNYSVVNEALDIINKPDIIMLHFSQVYPLPSSTLSLLKRARKVIGLENNATGQFCNLILRETGFTIKDKILKYNGMPFSVEEVISAIIQKMEQD